MFCACFNIYMNTMNHASDFKLPIICRFRNEILAGVGTVSKAASKTTSKYSVGNKFNISTLIKVISLGNYATK